MTRRFVAPGNWAHILRVERTLEFRKDSGFWALPNTLLPPPPGCVAGSFLGAPAKTHLARLRA